ncbi:hypothetical protein OH687_26045 [Burkholderia anthina]|nr:hypothetical protein OH687_26045 [Burkholderia anthina]
MRRRGARGGPPRANGVPRARPRRAAVGHATTTGRPARSAPLGRTIDAG